MKVLCVFAAIVAMRRAHKLELEKSRQMQRSRESADLTQLQAQYEWVRVCSALPLSDATILLYGGLRKQSQTPDVTGWQSLLLFESSTYYLMDWKHMRVVVNLIRSLCSNTFHAPTGRRWSCCRKSSMCCRSNTPGNAWKTLSSTRSCRTREKPWCSAKKRTEGFKRSRWKLVFRSAAAVCSRAKSSTTSSLIEADGEDAAVAKWETTTWLRWNERFLRNGGGKAKKLVHFNGVAHVAQMAKKLLTSTLIARLIVPSHNAVEISMNDRHLQGASQNEHMWCCDVTLEKKKNYFLVILWHLSLFFFN